MNDDMEVDSPAVAATATGATMNGLLMAHAESEIPVKEALGSIDFKHSETLSASSRFLKELPDQAPSSCGISLYSLRDSPEKKEMLNLQQRKSKFFFERDCFAPLYDQLIEIWTDKNKDMVDKVILTGNAGIGKSWFQVYLLRRLLRERQQNKTFLFRFVVRQAGMRFYLLDLDTCLGYELKSDSTGHFVMLLSNLTQTLYIYEPIDCVDQPPLRVSAPSLSSLSPRPRRVKEYEKSGVYSLYLPCWGFNELEFVADKEEMEISLLEENYEYFGGIARYTLENDRKVLEKQKKRLEVRCQKVTFEMLQNIALDIDDGPKADDQNNVSGFIVSYTPAGDNRFWKTSLTMTSKYARTTVLDNVSLLKPQEHMGNLLEVLAKKSQDITGKDLEVSVVYLLAAGPRTVGWSYMQVGGVGNWPEGDTLPVTYREINREETFDPLKINYSKEKMFGLVDCFTKINGVHWAFQTTWQYDHGLKLKTLLDFRAKLKLDHRDPLNLLFVNPTHGEVYWRREKAKYLVKGEELNQPIKTSKGETVPANDVAEMWNNTSIFVAFPKNNEWHKAVTEMVRLDKV